MFPLPRMLLPRHKHDSIPHVMQRPSLPFPHTAHHQQLLNTAVCIHLSTSFFHESESSRKAGLSILCIPVPHHLQESLTPIHGLSVEWPGAKFLGNQVLAN